MIPAILNGATLACLAIGVWRHDWRTILAAIALLAVWRLIGDQVDRELACTGCRKGAFMPGCPVHDPGRRSA